MLCTYIHTCTCIFKMANLPGKKCAECGDRCGSTSIRTEHKVTDRVTVPGLPGHIVITCQQVPQKKKKKKKKKKKFSRYNICYNINLTRITIIPGKLW